METGAIIKVLRYLKGLRGANILLTDDGNCLVLIGSQHAPYNEREMLFINRKVLEILNKEKSMESYKEVNNPISIQTVSGVKIFEILSGLFWKSAYKDKIGWYNYYENQHTYLTPVFSAINIKELKLTLYLYARINKS